MPTCCCVIGCQHSTLNRLFGCVFLVWRHHLRKVNKSSVRTFKRFFPQFSYFLMFLSIQIDLITLKTYDKQFTLTTKQSLHIIFNAFPPSAISHAAKKQLVQYRDQMERPERPTGEKTFCRDLATDTYRGRPRDRRVDLPHTRKRAR